MGQSRLSASRAFHDVCLIAQRPSPKMNHIHISPAARGCPTSHDVTTSLRQYPSRVAATRGLCHHDKDFTSCFTIVAARSDERVGRPQNSTGFDRLTAAEVYKFPQHVHGHLRDDARSGVTNSIARTARSWIRCARRPTTEGTPRAERNARKLPAVFIQHTDSKPAQQRLICVSEHEKPKNGEPCAETFMMVTEGLPRPDRATRARGALSLAEC